MENEYHERVGSGRRPSDSDRNPNDVGADRNPRSKRRSRDDDRDIARETLENLQGNVYREKPVDKGGNVGADRNPRSDDQPKTSRAGADNNPGKSDRDPKTRESSAKKSSPKRPNIIVQVLNGDILTRDFVLNNLTYIFFFLFLLLLVVSKGYYGKQLTKDIDTLQTEVNASTAEYIENKAKLEELTARYRLVEMLERRGLKESLKPAKVIRIKRPEK